MLNQTETRFCEAFPVGKSVHFAQFFESDEYLGDAVARFVAAGLAEGAGALVFATNAHLRTIEERLAHRGVDIESAKKCGQLRLRDAAAALATLMDETEPDSKKFREKIGGLVEDLSSKYPKVYAYGEMAELLWNGGNAEATIALEKLWNELATSQALRLFCGYSLSSFGEVSHKRWFSEVCETHTHVLPSEAFLKVENRADQLRAVALLQQQALSLQAVTRAAQVRGQEEKFRLLVESVKDYAIFMLDPHGNVASWNEGAKRFKGYEAKDILGQHFSKFYPEDEKATKPPLELEVASQVGRFEDEGWRIRKDGSQFWANVVITAMRDAEGALVGFSKVTRDLTERKRGEDALRAARERFEKQAMMFDTALSSSPDFYYIFDTNQRLIYVNQSLLELWGLTLDEALGRNFEELGYPPELVKLHESQFNEVLRTRKSIKGENPYKGSEGATGYYEYIFVPVLGSDGSIQAISGTTRDVTERKQAEESLRKSQEFLDSVVENLPNMVFVKDAKELRFVRFNRAGEELLGLARSELIGKNDYDLFPKKEADHFVSRDRQVLAGCTILDLPEVPLETRTKGRRILHTRKIPILGLDGAPEYLLGISEDITERKIAEEERLRIVREQASIEERKRENERATFLAEASTILASSLDYHKTLCELARLTVPVMADWCTVTILNENGTKERVAAVHRDPSKSALIEELSRQYPAGANDDGVIGRVIISGKSVFTPKVADSKLVGAANDERHLRIMRELACHSCIVVPIFARGKSMGAISIISSSVDRLYNENDLATVEELGRRAGIAIDNAFLYEAAQKAIRARDEFMSIASHELKTPLTSLKLQVQIRNRDLKKGELRRFSPEKLPQLIADDEKQVNRLIRLVDDMLDVARVQSGKLSLTGEEFDLCEMVQDTLTRFSAQIEEKGCSLYLDTEGVAAGSWDRFRMEQVFVNLLTNSLKYGAGKPIEVRVRREGDRAQIAVSDQGIGIAKEDQDRIFGQFERAVSASSISGLGVGLYISKRIVEAHGGEIRVESKLGLGSTFIVDLPLDAMCASGNRGAPQ